MISTLQFKWKLLLLVILLNTVHISAQSFDWKTDGYQDQSDGGTFKNVDNSGVNIEISGIVNGDGSKPTSVITGINDGQPNKLIHTYKFTFSEPVNIKFTIWNITKKDGHDDKLTLSGNPIFSGAKDVMIKGNTVQGIYPNIGDSCFVHIEYKNKTLIEITHGSGIKENPGFVIISKLNFEIYKSEKEFSEEFRESVKNRLRLYPIPAKTILTLELDSADQLNQTYFIDMHGRILPATYYQEANKVYFDTDGLMPASYVLYFSGRFRTLREENFIDDNFAFKIVVIK